jgi:hypothetical protein
MAGIAHWTLNGVSPHPSAVRPEASRTVRRTRAQVTSVVISGPNFNGIRVLIGSMMQAVTVPNENGDPPWPARELLRELETYASPALRERRLRFDASCPSDIGSLMLSRARPSSSC